ncbi:MAG: ATP-dependent metallopeptidase FtsH/Yme1/Tma family protein [Sulfurovum sp.]|nr:ATP-dependent metallopeptidase FtsH/Yme1/Tma family protein [Sulfurovum sp.]
MKETKGEFKFPVVHAKNIKVIVGLLIVLLVLLVFGTLRDTDTLITHEEANALYTKDKIQKVIIDGSYIRLITSDENYKIYKDAINKTAFFTKYPVEVHEENSYVYDISFLLILLAGFMLLFRFMKQNRLEQLKHIKSANKSSDEPRNESIQALTSTVTFEDVAGIKDVKEELEEIIDFLKEPQKYRDFDIRLPKGVLLIGPPGVGKTLIAKAVAGEANVPFFYQSGASFVHIYVGMGVKRVSELFKKAKQMAPSIIFIDEIDAVGKSRGGSRNDEREATLNQLLTEMDGFEDSSGVIVIAATNKVEMLDEALLRAGRFDRRIHISLPDLEDRRETLVLYLTKKPNNVNIDKIALLTVGFNSAALDTLTNEAAIYAMRAGRTIVETSDFEAVKEKVLLGKRKILSFTEEEREMQAIYQGAKAVIATWVDIAFDKIGIVNTQLLTQEHEILSRNQLLSRIKMYLAGSLATKIHYGEQFTNGASDIAQAKEVIRKVVHDYMMNDNFIVTPKQEDELLQKSVSEVSTLLKTLDKAHKEISEHLLTHENITSEECREILRKIF